MIKLFSLISLLAFFSCKTTSSIRIEHNKGLPKGLVSKNLVIISKEDINKIIKDGLDGVKMGIEFPDSGQFSLLVPLKSYLKFANANIDIPNENRNDGIVMIVCKCGLLIGQCGIDPETAEIVLDCKPDKYSCRTMLGGCLRLTGCPEEGEKCRKIFWPFPMFNGAYIFQCRCNKYIQKPVKEYVVLDSLSFWKNWIK